MKPSHNSINLLGVTRSKAKMYEYSVPLEEHISIAKRHPAYLFPISIGLLGDVASEMLVQNPDQTALKENLKELRFSALFLDSYIQTHLDDDLDEYLALLAAATYYLCDIPGSSTAILKRVNLNSIRNDSSDLKKFLLWILESNFDADFELTNAPYINDFSEIKNLTRSYFSGRTESQAILTKARELRKKIYKNSSPRELLLTDVSLAVLWSKIKNSARNLLFQFTNIEINTWNSLLQRDSFIKELWPSQRLLGEKNVFKGASAVIQMPTSAGKSKSIELIIRSAFLSGRTKNCVVVAPFRALCREITENLEKAFKGDAVTVNELSDVFQADFSTDDLLQSNSLQILSVTPEKLVYVLRQSPELANKIGLLVLDEGHQFDSGARGVTYELLITNLKELLPQSVQTILISAVISNAEAICSWLLGENGQVVSDSSLTATFRTVGFTTWIKQQGQIQYVKPNDITSDEFFVPRVIEKQTLAKRGRETKTRLFPDPKDGKTVAAHLGIKLIKNGTVAIFCGVKATATKLAEAIIDASTRGYSASELVTHSNQNELDKISTLFTEHFGQYSIESLAAKAGILTHHAGIPHGLRLATEKALRVGDAKFIICTSTLAQGVNLPIRYLLFTNIYQAGERLKVRDFHNLIGRAGRSGIQTEGTILFADPEVYDNKNHWRNGWRFHAVQELFDSTKSEPCSSSLLKIFDPILLLNDDETMQLEITDSQILNLLEYSYTNGMSLKALVEQILNQNNDHTFNGKNLLSQFKYKFKIADTVESYLISALVGKEDADRIAFSTEIAKKTLAYSLASVEQKTLLEKLFNVICQNVDIKVPSEDKKSSYGRTLLGVTEMLEIDQWVEDNSDAIILSSESDDDLFVTLYPVIEKYIDGETLKKFSTEEARFLTSLGWILGKSYFTVLSELQAIGAKVIAGSQRRKITLPHIVDVCDGELAYDGMLVLGAIAELLEAVPEYSDTTIPDSLRLLQKRIKYGLPDKLSVRIYELGFSDRVVAQKLSGYMATKNVSNNYMLIQEIKNNMDEVRGILASYPSYFSDVLNKFEEE